MTISKAYALAKAAAYARADRDPPAVTLKLEALAEEWLAAKNAETLAITARRAAEDRIAAVFYTPPGTEGMTTHQLGRYACQTTHRVARKIDSEMLSVIAAEHGIEHLLPVIFRWKAEIKAKEWRALDQETESLLSKAITATPARAGFKITERENT